MFVTILRSTSTSTVPLLCVRLILVPVPSVYDAVQVLYEYLRLSMFLPILWSKISSIVLRLRVRLIRTVLVLILVLVVFASASSLRRYWYRIVLGLQHVATILDGSLYTILDGSSYTIQYLYRCTLTSNVLCNASRQYGMPVWVRVLASQRDRSWTVCTVPGTVWLRNGTYQYCTVLVCVRVLYGFECTRRSNYTVQYE